MNEVGIDNGHEHADVTGGWLRPALFGAMDGLVSNVALIAGVSGGTAGSGSTDAIVLAGVAGLSAGAFSMAVGEYNSVASQSEAGAFEVEKERRELLRNPEGEEAELAAMFTAKGVHPHTAAEMASQIHQDHERALAVHAKEELGIEPHELASPTLAAVSSFIAFALGAFVPLAPYLFAITSLWLSVVLTLAALFVCGALVTRVTTKSWWFGGGRMLLLGAGAAGLTYLVGGALG